MATYIIIENEVVAAIIDSESKTHKRPINNLEHAVTAHYGTPLHLVHGVYKSIRM